MAPVIYGRGEERVDFVDRTGNPAPLGLAGFGITTILLNIHNAGLFKLDSMILGLGFFYGGMAQLIAGIMEWTKGNTFATTAFISYGSFWLSLCVLVIAPETGAIPGPTAASMASYFFVWGSFTGVLLMAAKTSMLKVVFFTLTLLFYLLTLYEVTHSIILLRITGIEGIVTGLSALYTGLAQVLNESKGRIVWPTDNLFTQTPPPSTSFVSNDLENQDEERASLTATKAMPPKRQSSATHQDAAAIRVRENSFPLPTV